MKIKTSELKGAALDWAVAQCEGEEVTLVKGQLETRWTEDGWKPSTDWAQGGPIIEREKIDVRYRIGVNMTANIGGQYEQTAGHRESANPMLLAAMRCYVASKLGDEVEIPNELKGEGNV